MDTMRALPIRVDAPRVYSCFNHRLGYRILVIFNDIKLNEKGIFMC